MSTAMLGLLSLLLVVVSWLLLKRMAGEVRVVLEVLARACSK